MSPSDRAIILSLVDKVYCDDTLASNFSYKKGGDLIEVISLVAKGFDVHERDSHVHI